MESAAREDRRAVIAAEVRAEMARRNASRAQLAAAAGISAPTLRTRLAGKTPFFFEELEGIASLFNVTVAEITQVGASNE